MGSQSLSTQQSRQVQRPRRTERRGSSEGITALLRGDGKAACHQSMDCAMTGLPLGFTSKKRKIPNTSTHSSLHLGKSNQHLKKKEQTAVSSSEVLELLLLLS